MYFPSKKAYFAPKSPHPRSSQDMVSKLLWVKRTFSQSIITQSINQSSKQAINQSIIQSINQSIN
jgi:hypothetical protein